MPAIVERFAREARAAARIRSEHSVHVYDVGMQDGRGPFIVMEFLSGLDLKEILDEQGPLLVKRTVEYALHACEALAIAHTSGVTHRDIKPENLFLAKRADGTELIKVLDFGISKVALFGNKPRDSIPGQELMGSPAYMSPEQFRGGE